MTNRESRLLVKQDGKITQVDFLDRNILDEASIQQIGDQISELIEQSDKPRLLINFEHVEHLSSAALGTLITINNKIRLKGGQLRLTNIDPQILEVFEITRLDQLFQIHNDIDAAVESFK